MKKNKIWLIANKSEVGGGETFQLDLAKGLESKGWHPLLLIPNDGRFSNLAKKNNINTLLVHIVINYLRRTIEN